MYKFVYSSTCVSASAQSSRAQCLHGHRTLNYLLHGSEPDLLKTLKRRLHCRVRLEFLE